MRAEKRDRNEQEIVAALEAFGCSVDRLPGGNGRPDLLVGIASIRCKRCCLIEVKDPSQPAAKRRLNPLQKKWHAAWKGRAHLVETVEQALGIVRGYADGVL